MVRTALVRQKQSRLHWGSSDPNTPNTCGFQQCATKLQVAGSRKPLLGSLGEFATRWQTNTRPFRLRRNCTALDLSPAESPMLGTSTRDLTQSLYPSWAECETLDFALFAPFSM